MDMNDITRQFQLEKESNYDEEILRIMTVQKL